MRIFVLEVIHHSLNTADTSNIMKLFETLVYSPVSELKQATFYIRVTQNRLSRYWCAGVFVVYCV
jgi:hypothetical protein